jgi:hypothetical protein
MLPAHLQEAWLQMMREGYALADCGAFFAARREFVRTLYEIAQAMDAHCGDTYHAASLSRGLRALEEAADFLPSDSSISAPLDTGIVVDPHQTPVGRDQPAGQAPNILFSAYHDYAQQQLAQAVGGVRAGSMALHALGKVYSRLAQTSGDRYRDAADWAITLQESALSAHGGNFLAANELGVLIARSGDYARAQQLFVHSMQLKPNAEADHNLHTVQMKLAQASHPGPPTAAIPPGARVTQRPQVQWMSMNDFVSVSDPIVSTPPQQMPYASQPVGVSAVNSTTPGQPHLPPHVAPQDRRVSQRGTGGWSGVRGIFGFWK